MTNKVFLLLKTDFATPEVIAIYETQDIADAEAARLNESRPSWAIDVEYYVEMKSISRPLDPEPWINRGDIHHRAAQPVGPLASTQWRFQPRYGYAKGTLAYAEAGGVDPTPWRVPGGHHYEARWSKLFSELHPREGFATDPSLYVDPLPLDPQPWVYALLGPAKNGYTPARADEQITGGFAFDPRDGYEQDRSKYV